MGSGVPVEVRIGQGFEDIVESIRSAKKRVWVVTPWLSPEYARLLVEKASEGVDVRVYTTDDPLPAHRRALRELVEERRVVVRPASRSMRLLALALVALGVPALLAAAPLGVLLLVAAAAVYRLGMERYSVSYIPRLGEGRLAVFQREAGRAIHAKVYVIDGRAAVGSVNLTESGVRDNVECLAWIDDPQVVERVAAELESLEERLRLRKAPLDAVLREALPARRR